MAVNVLREPYSLNILALSHLSFSNCKLMLYNAIAANKWYFV